MSLGFSRNGSSRRGDSGGCPCSVVELLGPWLRLSLKEFRRRKRVKESGLHTTAREPKRAHFRARAFKNTTKIPREDPQEREERMKIVVGEGKKRANIWAVLWRGSEVRWCGGRCLGEGMSWGGGVLGFLG